MQGISYPASVLPGANVFHLLLQGFYSWAMVWDWLICSKYFTYVG